MTPIKTLESRIPNLYDFFTKEEVENILKGYNGKGKIESYFMSVDEVWDKPVRRCTNCGRLMNKGYCLGDDYACSDECRDDMYKDEHPELEGEDLEKAYLYDYFKAKYRGYTFENWLSKPIEELRKLEEYGDEDICYYTEW